MKKKIILTAAGIACICLTGCGKQEVRELAGSYNGTVPHSIEIEYGIKNTASINIKADVNKNAAHGNLAIAGTVPKSAEFYRDDATSYIYDADLEYWTASEDGIITDLAFLFDGLDPGLFPDEKVKYDKKEKAYIIKQPFDSFMMSQDYMDMTALLGEMGIASGGGSDEEYVSYAFDKEGNLLSVAADGSIKIDVRFAPSEQTIEIPDGVKTSAKTTDFSMDFADIYEPASESASGSSSGNTASSSGSGTAGADDISGTASSIDPGFVVNYEGNIDPGMAMGSAGQEDIDPGMVVEPDTGTDNADSSYNEGTAAGTGYGSYNDQSLSDSGNEWASTFGDTGWGFTTDDYTESYLKSENPQYPGAVFTVYGQNKNEDTSAYDIIKYGFCDYDIDCRNTKAYPPFSWNGLTFGASAEEIKNVYGEPNVTYTGDDDTAYRYFMEEGELIFFVNNNGLGRVSFSR